MNSFNTKSEVNVGENKISPHPDQKTSESFKHSHTHIHIQMLITVVCDQLLRCDNNWVVCLPPPHTHTGLL